MSIVDKPYDLYEKLPDKNAIDIMESVYVKGETSGVPELEEIIDNLYKDINTIGFGNAIMKFYTQEDKITDMRYVKNGDKITIPYAGSKLIKSMKNKGVNNIMINGLGDQSSQYHQESLNTHIGSVVGRLAEQEMERANETGKFNCDLLLVGLCHDIGKKYTIAANKKGDVCYYNHEALSAYITARLLKKMNVEEERASIIVGAIYGHLKPKLWNSMYDAKKGETEEQVFERHKNEYVSANGTSGLDLAFKILDADTGYKNIDEIQKDSEIIGDGLEICSIINPLEDFSEEVENIMNNEQQELY